MSVCWVSPRLPHNSIVHARYSRRMKVLVVGSGAREHALVRSLLGDPSVAEVVVAPGNGGIAADVPTRSVDVSSPTAVADLADQEDADLVVIGPELPLVKGAADAVRGRGIPCFGPSSAAAQLEGSKIFAKEVMEAAGVPTAASRACDTLSQVEAALAEFGPPHVVKDDGLAGGKGVVVTDDLAVAIEHAETCIAEGGKILVEEFLDGPEVSLFVITDGVTAIPLLPAQDFKRVGEGDVGPNTGGMGAYAPLPWAPDTLVSDIMREVAEPTLAEMSSRGIPFQGVLYCGLALTSRGIRVVEFNARFGDPEIQAVLSLLESPLGAVLQAAATQGLADLPELSWRKGAAVNVVVAAEGYPNSPIKGDTVFGLPKAGSSPGVHVLHAGTQLVAEKFVVSGGRVLSVVGVGDDVAGARDFAYEGIAEIRLRGSHTRGDIAAGI